MQVRRFLVHNIPEPGGRVELPPGEALHAGRVLRLQSGDRVQLLDGRGVIADATVVSEGAGRRFEGMSCLIGTRTVVAASVPVLRLYVAPPRPKLMGFVVRCATELGVRRITPLLCEFSVSRPDARASLSWREDAVAAVKQSGNPFLPEIDVPCSFGDALSRCSEPGVFGAVGSAGAGAVMPRLSGGNLGVWIGPEGGFSSGEEEGLSAAGLTPITVGRWVLRIETAVPAVLGMVHGNLSDE